MTLRPGDFLGLPPELALDPSQQPVLRYTLVVLAVAWAAIGLRAARAWTVLAGIVFVEVVLVFWIAGFGRPYGLFIDPVVTRSAAEVATAPLGGEEGFLAGERREMAGAPALAAAVLPTDTALVLPTVLPLLVVPALALAVFLLARPREEAALAAVLWLAFSTGQAEAVRGAGFLPGLWARPGPALCLLAVVTLALAAGRLERRGLATALAVVAVSSWAAVLSPIASPPAGDRVLLATFDQSPWIFLALLGVARGASIAGAALAGGGAILFVLGPLWGADGWGAHAMYRLGLMLLSAGPLAAALRWLVERLAPVRLRARFPDADRLGLAGLLVVALPGSFLMQWNPGTLDGLAFASREPLSANVMPAMAWIREHVPPPSACVVSPDYAPMVAVLGRRRVLRAPSLMTLADDQRRRRAERMLVAAREPDLVSRYGVGCFVFASGDEGWLGLAAREDLERLAALVPGYRDRYVWVFLTAPGMASP